MEAMVCFRPYRPLSRKILNPSRITGGDRSCCQSLLNVLRVGALGARTMLLGWGGGGGGVGSPRPEGASEVERDEPDALFSGSAPIF